MDERLNEIEMWHTLRYTCSIKDYIFEHHPVDGFFGFQAIEMTIERELAYREGEMTLTNKVMDGGCL